MAFVKEYHTTGLVWNPNGGNATQLAGSAGTLFICVCPLSYKPEIVLEF
jgi:hypothetical protein